MANKKNNDSDQKLHPTPRMTEEEIENLDLEDDKVKELMEQYKEETGKYAIWRIPAKYLITRGFKRWLKGEKIYHDKERISRHEEAEAKETKSRVKEEDKIYLKRIISGEDILMSIPEGKDITKPKASYYDILFVEGLGYPDTITLPMTYFESKGYSCQGVCGGKKGFDELYINIPKVILLDIILPDFSGYEICKQIKSNPKWKDIPVFFFTTIPGSEVERHMEETGADGYILKPFSFSDFDGILDLLKNKRIK
jgi:CheY-like chemotaxis protein